ncbi:MAG: hypothetical protein KGS61_06100 [Verrucomicrobia bacterium]|nr:hypothetical protein [Verrucomicrobiota bacterium]
MNSADCRFWAFRFDFTDEAGGLWEDSGRFDGSERRRQCYRMIAVEDTISKLQALSPERAERVVSLINDLAELQALEDKRDLEEARAAPAERGEDVSWPELHTKLDAVHDHHPPDRP